MENPHVHNTTAIYSSEDRAGVLVLPNTGHSRDPVKTVRYVRETRGPQPPWGLHRASPTLARTPGAAITGAGQVGPTTTEDTKDRIPHASRSPSLVDETPHHHAHYALINRRSESQGGDSRSHYDQLRANTSHFLCIFRKLRNVHHSMLRPRSSNVIHKIPKSQAMPSVSNKHGCRDRSRGHKRAVLLGGITEKDEKCV